MAKTKAVLSETPASTDEAGLSAGLAEGLDAPGYLTIGGLAQLCGITVRTLRYYEQMDLIGPVKRSDSKYRLYNQHSLKRLKAILALQDLNYSLEEILVTLGPYSKRQELCKQEQLAESRRSLNLQKNFIDGKLKQLKTMKKDIETRLATLDEVCTPCVQSAAHAHEHCPDTCHYFHVHD